MVQERVQRRLAAILAADVAGYSRLMGADEEGTLAQLKAHRRDLVDPKINEHRGRIVKTTGDGLLAEFASVVDALRCATEVQCGMAEHNAEVPPATRIEFRMGINVGDVIIEGSDIFGDGVNVAARLEALAEPGGICVSGRVQEDARSKLDLAFQDAGEQQLKNIAWPVRVYRVRLDHRNATSRPVKAVSDKPSIAVLPFVNLSGDPTQQYFSDGLTEDIITELARFHSLLVIARNSSFQYGDAANDIKRVSRELGVQYVVEGSVRKAGHRVRITVQLIDATTGAHVWANRYDRELEHIFEIQDEVTATIVATLVGQVQASGIERVRRTESLAAYDLFLRALEHWNRAGSDDTIPARDLLTRATEIDPNFAQAYSLLAFVLLEVWSAEIWSRSPQDSTDTLSLALRVAQRAVMLDGNDAFCHCALGAVHLHRQSFGLAAHHTDFAIALNPNDAEILANRSVLELHTGRSQAALHSLDLAMKLNPTPPNWYREAQGMALYNLRRYAEAANAFELATAKRPYVYRFLAACYAQMRRFAEARALVDEALALQPDFTLRVWRTQEPYESRTDLEHMVEGMRKAGLPD